MKKDVSVIIVNYNTRDLLSDCIASVIKMTEEVDYEIIVSDNGSSDGSEEQIRSLYPDVAWLSNNANLGFGAANNRALDLAEGRYIFYLNSDTVLLNNAVKCFFDYWEEHQDEPLGCIGCQLLSKERKPIHSFAAYPTPAGILKALLHMTVVALLKRPAKAGATLEGITEARTIDGYITGADMFLKNNEAARFDERYFMYSEEADLQYNGFYKTGLQCRIIPGPEIIHLEGASDTTKTTPVYDFSRRSVAWLWMSYIRYMRKNHPNARAAISLCKLLLNLNWTAGKNREACKEYKRQLKSL